MKKNPKLVAAIDVGSNAINMLVAQLDEKGNIAPLEDLKKMTNLGKDTYSDGRISILTMQETAKTLQNFVSVMNAYRIRTYRAVTTSGIREAQNRDYILNQIKVSTGLEIEVINNSIERFLTYKSIRHYLPKAQQMKQDGLIVLDIGSGGVEITLYDQGALQFTDYVKIGSLRLKENLADLENLASEYSSLLEAYIESKIYMVRDKIKKFEIRHFVAISGEMNSIYQFIRPGESTKTNRYLSREEMQRFYHLVTHQNKQRLAQSMEIDEKQTEMVLPTAAIVMKVMDMTGTAGLFTPHASLRYGILCDMADEWYDTPKKQDFLNDIRSSIVYLSKRYKIDENHADYVTAIALEMFDSTRKIHGLALQDRFNLEVAAMLHDVGKYVNINNHDQMSYNILSSIEIIGISDENMRIIAHVARCHADQRPYDSDDFLALPYEEKMRISKLAALLKISDSLDITHKRNIQKVVVKIRESQVILKTQSVSPCELEKWAAEKKADFFEEVMGYRPIIK